MNQTEIFSGVWKISFGVPEEFTPDKFRYKEINSKPLNEKPFKGEKPSIIDSFDFSSSKRGSRIIANMTNEEKIYGLGLNTKLFDKTDKRCIVRPTDHPETDENGSHAPVPFFVSTEGYGVYVDTARYATFYFGCTMPLYITESVNVTEGIPSSSTDELYRQREVTNKTMLIDIPVAEGVDIYVFAGENITEVVERFNLFSGGGCVPPLWGLGVQYRGDAGYSSDEHEALAKSFREDKIPCDMWGLEPGWQTQVYSCSYIWNEKLYPNPTAFAKNMKDIGLHVNVWQHCFTHPTSPIYEDIFKYSSDFKVWNGAVPDFTMKEAVDIFSNFQKETLFSKEGIDCIKLDECDHQPEGLAYWSFPESATFPSGMDGEQMHSLFGYLYQKVMLKPLVEENKRTWGLVRNSHALASSLPYTIYSDSYNQECYLRGLANTGFSGLLWVPEVREASSIEDFYRRIQICLMSPLMLVNSWYLKLPPWKQINTELNREFVLMDNHEKVTSNVRDLFNLRMSLVPYMYNSFIEYKEKGTPPLRAIVMDNTKDSNTYGIDNQFMFGDRLMITPCLTEKSTRKVYFPANSNNWVDFYTGERYEGGKEFELNFPIERLPIFVMDNCILPIAEPVEHISEDTVFEIKALVFGSDPKPFTLYEDDGISYDFEKGYQNKLEITYNKEKNSIEVDKSGNYKGKQRYNIESFEIKGK